MENLKHKLCPECNGYITFDDDSKVYSCSECEYRIGEVNYDYAMAVLESIEKEYHIPDTDENLQGLNRL